jgi:hypothetical protein
LIRSDFHLVTAEASRWHIANSWRNKQLLTILAPVERIANGAAAI